MPTQLQQPVLLGTVGLAISVAWMGFDHHGLPDLINTVALWGLGGLGVALVLVWRQQPSLVATVTPPLSMSRVKQALVEAETLLQQLAAETTETAPDLQQRLTQITAGLERQELTLAIAGHPAVGKSTLLQWLQTQWLPQLAQPHTLVELAELGHDPDRGADLVVFLVQGDLSQPEFDLLQRLQTAQQRTLVVLNKQDQYLPDQRQVVLQKLQERLQGMVSPTDLLAIAAHPQPLKVRQYQSDGSCQEWLEQPQPQLQAFIERLNQVVTQEASQLVMQQSFRQAMALQTDIRLRLNQVRRERALPIIERYQWIAAGTAFANPLPTLDLLATAAITGQMVVDLGTLYQQPLSLAQGKAIARTLASLMLKLGLVEFSTQTVGALLKGHAITYVAGGLLQGVSAAYLTRMAGLSLIEHFQTVSLAGGTATRSQPEQLGQILQRVFQQHQRLVFLKGLIPQVLEHLRGQTSGQGRPALATAEGALIDVGGDVLGTAVNSTH